MSGTSVSCPPGNRSAATALDGAAFHRYLADWPLSSVLDLRALPTAVPCARLHVRIRLHEWDLGALAETAGLITSELSTNAVSAVARLPEPLVRLRVSAGRQGVLIEVWDASPQMPALREPGLDEESGRGLQLVAVLSDTWGAYPCQVGKIAWAIVKRQA
jgi:anti-sigma regulatory factor (Ser/Thr protein kinase)